MQRCRGAEEEPELAEVTNVHPHLWPSAPPREMHLSTKMVQIVAISEVQGCPCSWPGGARAELSLAAFGPTGLSKPKLWRLFLP